MRFVLSRLLVVVFVLTGFAAGVAPVAAGPLELSPAKPSIRITAPDEWASTRIPRGVQTNSRDEELFVWLEVYSPGELNAVIAEHDAYWKKQGVVVRGRNEQTGEKDGRSFTVTQMDALWNGEPTILYYMDLDLKLPSARRLVLTYWASPKGDRIYAERFEALLDSLVVSER